MAAKAEQTENYSNEEFKGFVNYDGRTIDSTAGQVNLYGSVTGKSGIVFLITSKQGGADQKKTIDKYRRN